MNNIKLSLRIIVTFVTIYIFTASCYYRNEEELYPEPVACDTLNITFSGTIKPLLANNCLKCHSNALAAVNADNIRLEDYADVNNMAPSISGAINRTGSFSPMPKNEAKLNACLIKQFDIWLNSGSPDN
jgi:hypothetical protein